MRVSGVEPFSLSLSARVTTVRFTLVFHFFPFFSVSRSMDAVEVDRLSSISFLSFPEKSHADAKLVLSSVPLSSHMWGTCTVRRNRERQRRYAMDFLLACAPNVIYAMACKCI